MKWKIISKENSVAARRLGTILGMEVSRKPEGIFDGLFVFGVSYWDVPSYPKLCPKIFCWTGTDSKYFLESKSSVNFGKNSIHIAGSPWVASKLSTKIDVVWVPRPFYLSTIDIEIGKPPGVLIYINLHEARDIDRTKKVIKLLPDIPIYLTAGQGRKVIKESFQNNIIDVGWISGEQRYDLFKKISVYLRLMNFDGTSQFVIEMKILGRHVFYTLPAPYCNYVKSEDSPQEIAQAIREQINVPIDLEGAAWYRKVFSKRNFVETIRSLCALKAWDFPYG